MTDLIKALSVALDRLSSIEETMNRLDRHSEMISRFNDRLDQFNDRLDRFEARLTKAETKAGNVDVCIDTICALETKVYKLGVETHDQINVNHHFEIRIQTLEERTLDDPEFERLLKRVTILEENGNGSEDLEDRVGEILDRKLDHVLEDAVTEALSGREITICL